MRISVGRLRQLFAEAMAEAKISAHPEYMKKEQVREREQQRITELVKTGVIKSQEELDTFWLAMTALKMVPFDVWSKMAGKTPAKKR
jgi:hypothetical protein